LFDGISVAQPMIMTVMEGVLSADRQSVGKRKIVFRSAKSE
jgi:hypothetical protein